MGEGVSALAAGVTATDLDLEWAERVLRGVGTVVRVAEQGANDLDGIGKKAERSRNLPLSP